VEVSEGNWSIKWSKGIGVWSVGVVFSNEWIWVWNVMEAFSVAVEVIK
jgi:hypothetical protein